MQRGGGVMVMIRDSYIAEEVEISEWSGEVIWVKIQLKGETPFMFPQCTDNHQTTPLTINLTS